MPTRRELAGVLDLYDLTVLAIAAGWALGFGVKLLRQRVWQDGYAAGVAGAKLRAELAATPRAD